MLAIAARSLSWSPRECDELQVGRDKITVIDLVDEFLRLPKRTLHLRWSHRLSGQLAGTKKKNKV